MLREAACLNVLPVRSVGTADPSQRTWLEGVEWVTQVLMHVAPEIVVCNGNGGGRSPWSALDSVGSGIAEVEYKDVYGTFRLKRGQIGDPNLKGATVIGLPHLGRMRSIDRLRDAAADWSFPVL